MKKIFTILSILILTVAVSAQKGSWYLGGAAGIATYSQQDGDGDDVSASTDWTFSPEFGTFLTDDIQLGLILGISGSSSEAGGEDESSSSYLTPTVYGRKFFAITDNFSTFAGLYLGYSSGTMTDMTGDEDIEYKMSGFGARVGVGIAYALSPRFTAVGQYGLVGFQSYSYEADGSDAGSESYFDFGVNTVGGPTPTQGNGSGAVFNIGIYYTIVTGSSGE